MDSDVGKKVNRQISQYEEMVSGRDSVSLDSNAKKSVETDNSVRGKTAKFEIMLNGKPAKVKHGCNRDQAFAEMNTKISQYEEMLSGRDSIYISLDSNAKKSIKTRNSVKGKTNKFEIMLNGEPAEVKHVCDRDQALVELETKIDQPDLADSEISYGIESPPRPKIDQPDLADSEISYGIESPPRPKELPIPEPESEEIQELDDPEQEPLATTPSTVFQYDGAGQQRVSPWGPPSRSVTKKKGWENPVPPAPKHAVPQQRIILENELFNVFDRRGKGMSIGGKSGTVADNVGGLSGKSGKHEKDNDIGGNVHVRVSYTTPDTLHVTLKRAEHLCSKTKSCSPYAMITLLGEYKVQNTEVINNTTTPNWDTTFDFDVPLQQLQTTAALIVVYNKHGVRDDEFIGEMHLSLATFKHFQVIDSWFTLEDLRGEEEKFDGYKEFQKVHSSIKTRCLSDTLKQDELRKEENYSSY